ncbi:hypothetical protein BpHYR1_005265, partial [Brachionus plicatilis]
NNIKKLQAIQNAAVRSILKLKYDTPSNIVHHEAFNKLKLLTVSNRLFLLSERYVGTGLSHSIPLVVRLVKEYKEGFESRYIEYPTPLSFSSDIPYAKEIKFLGFILDECLTFKPHLPFRTNSTNLSDLNYSLSLIARLVNEYNRCFTSSFVSISTPLCFLTLKSYNWLKEPCSKPFFEKKYNY